MAVVVEDNKPAEGQLGPDELKTIDNRSVNINVNVG
jgi:hypothetical protein